MNFVFDLDDTISRHKNRDYPNAVPIEGTIKKIRRLSEAGCTITIYSSRGQNSCKGELALIEERNRGQVEEWLRRHNVPYDRLVFGKPLGDVYVDDKGVGLDEFLREEYVPLKGNSGAEVFRAGKRVLKRGASAKTEAEWYGKAAQIGLRVPKVNSVVLDCIDLEYITGVPGNEKNLSTSDLGELVSKIALMSFHRAESSFDTAQYLELIVSRLSIAGWEDRFSKLLKYFEEHGNVVREESSFSHGDFTLSNTVFSESGVYLIDPSSRTEFSTYLNDFAKLRFSLNGGEQLLHGGERPGEYDSRLNELSKTLYAVGKGDLVKALEAGHWIRMLGYFSKERDRDLIWSKAKALEAEL